MDNNDRRQRHNVPRHPSHPGALQSQAQYPVVGATDRFRQAPQAAAAQTPTSAPQGSRIPSQSYYAYQGHPQYAASNVQPSYGAQEYGAETPQRAAPYAQYGMYNVPGAQAAASGQSQYDPVQPYQQGRDSGAIEVLNSGFGSVPQAAAQYYMPGQEGPAGTAAAAMPTQSVPSQYSSLAYTGQQAPAERESMTPQYSAAGMTDSRQAPSQEQEYPPSYRAKSGEHEEFYTTFNNLLKTSNEHSSKGRCREAAETLIQVSDWLFQWAESVGEYTNRVRQERTAELTPRSSG